MMRRVIFWGAVLAFLSSSVCFGASTNDKPYVVRLFGLIEHFEWKEFLDGSELVKESGPLFGVGGEFQFRISGPLWAEVLGHIFAGEPDYEGAIQEPDGDLVAYDSETEYSGVEGQGMLSMKLPVADALILKPYGGMGLRVWERTLDTGLGDKYIGRYGYQEDWVTLYGVIGIEGSVAFSGPGLLYARGEVHLPVYNRIEYDLSNVGGPDSADVEPGKKTSFLVEGGLSYSFLYAAVYYETMKFGESDLADEANVFQPESEAKMLGVKAGLVF